MLPHPPLPVTLDVPADPVAPLDTALLPSKPGVFLMHDASGRAVAAALTANLRRLIRSRLEPPEPSDQPSRRINYREAVRTVRAVTVGSAFESEWAYLQLARRSIPSSYRGLLDRWRGWFVHCNPAAAFPRWIKTATPGSAPTGRTGVYLGPIPTKHDAQKYIEMLDEAFDLCRYHHILVQSPETTACAYKEMGKCPAPCDGTVSMDAYRAQVRDAIEFAGEDAAQWRDELDRQMQKASRALDFETAERLRRRLESTKLSAAPRFAWVDRIERFVFIGVMPSERAGQARLFVIKGGWIEPFADLPCNASDDDVMELIDAIRRRARLIPPPALDEHHVENIGLVCRHLFRNRSAHRTGGFLRWPQAENLRQVRRLLRSVARLSDAMPEESEVEDQMTNALADDKAE